MEALYHAPVVAAIFGQAEELQHLRGAFKLNVAALLPESEGRHTDRNETVLAEGLAEVGVRDDMKREFPVAALVRLLVFWKGTQRKATQLKWPGIEGNFLCAPLTVFPKVLDELKLLELVFGDAESRQDFAYRSERRTRQLRAIIESAWSGRHKRTWD